MSDQPDEILTTDEFPIYRRAGKRTVCRSVSTGKLSAPEPGGPWRLRQPELYQWMGSRFGKTLSADEDGREK